LHHLKSDPVRVAKPLSRRRFLCGARRILQQMQKIHSKTAFSTPQSIVAANAIAVCAMTTRSTPAQ
jgi:hypothetical protein